MKKILFTLISLLCLTMMFGCKKEGAKKTVNVRIPLGAPTLGMVKMIHEDKTVAGFNVNYETVSGPNLLISAITSKSHEIVIAPVNVGAKLYLSNPDYLYAGTLTMGNLYIISHEEITIDDLEGETIHAFGVGSTPEIVLRKVLGDRDVTIQAQSSAEIVNGGFVSGTFTHILIAEPALSLVKTKTEVKTVIDLQEEYEKLTGKNFYPQAGVFVNKEFAKKNPDFIKEFINKVAACVEFVNTEKSKAADYYEQEELSQNLPKDVIVASIPGSSIEFVNSQDSRPLIETLFEIVLEINGDLIGNELPPADFYWSEK